MRVADPTEVDGRVLARLVDDIRTVVATEPNEHEVARRVAALLPAYLAAPDLLAPAFRVSSPSGYAQHVVHAEGDGSFSVVSLVWLPGQETPVHDHLAWCVVGVVEGQEEEVLYALDTTGRQVRLVETERQRNAAGTVQALLPPGDIHCVRNPGPDIAISLHVYGVDVSRVGSSIRRYYPGMADDRTGDGTCSSSTM